MILSNSSRASDKLYVDDVFSTYLYTGNSSNQTITNGIDLAGKGGMVWLKNRGAVGSYLLVDSVRGISNQLSSDATGGQVNGGVVTGITSTGFSLGNNSYNSNTNLYTSWASRKAPKFFDVVTWTGNSTAGMAIPHSLGVKPGMIIVKATSTVKGWYVWHRSLSDEVSSYLVLNSAAAIGSYNMWHTPPDANNFYVSSSTDTNGSGITYVAYLFAHDTSADGIIQCGSYVGTGTVAGPIINLGWEPQYILIKNTNTAADWVVYDNARGMPVGGSTATLYPNNTAVENTPHQAIKLTATGFQVDPSGVGVGHFNSPAGNTFVYMAIRRSNKPPTAGTQVFQPVTYVGDGVANRLVNTGILTDFILAKGRASAGSGYEGMVVGSRLTGDKWMKTALQQAEQAAYGLQSPTSGYGNSFSAMNGFGVTNTTVNSPYYGNLNANSASYVVNSFKRAPRFMDVVCFNMPSSNTNQRVNHNLGVTPELIIVKSRNPQSDATTSWVVYAGDINKYLALNTTSAVSTISGLWGTAAPTNSDFGINPIYFVYGYGENGVAYMFATLPGISKVGNYIGNGSNQTINCGFSTGARFILIKRADSTGDWYICDSARGIVSANDPHLSLNTTAAEVITDDSVDPDNNGFIVNQVAATNINVNNATYIYLAIA